MLTDETAWTAWYAETYDERLQHVLLQPLPVKSKRTRARLRPVKQRRALARRSRMALVVGLLVLAMFMATSMAYAQCNPPGTAIAFGS